METDQTASRASNRLKIGKWPFRNKFETSMNKIEHRQILKLYFYHGAQHIKIVLYLDVLIANSSNIVLQKPHICSKMAISLFKLFQLGYSSKKTISKNW